MEPNIKVHTQSNGQTFLSYWYDLVGLHPNILNIKYFNKSFSVVTSTVLGATHGQDCCPEGGWGVLLRKDGDPVYKDKGVIVKSKSTQLISHSSS